MPEAERPADGLSILCLASGLASLVLMLFSLMPLIGFCLAPLSAIAAVTALVSGIASLVRTTANPALEGRWQALFGLGLALLWCLGAAILFTVMMRH